MKIFFSIIEQVEKFLIQNIINYFLLNKMKKGKPSVGFSVCVLIFCSLLGGIFLLCSKDEEYAAPAPATAEVEL